MTSVRAARAGEGGYPTLGGKNVFLKRPYDLRGGRNGLRGWYPTHACVRVRGAHGPQFGTQCERMGKWSQCRMRRVIRLLMGWCGLRCVLAVRLMRLCSCGCSTVFQVCEDWCTSNLWHIPLPAVASFRFVKSLHIKAPTLALWLLGGCRASRRNGDGERPYRCCRISVRLSLRALPTPLAAS